MTANNAHNQDAAQIARSDALWLFASACVHAPSPDSVAVPVDASRDIEPLFRAVAYKKVDELIEDEGKDAGER